MSDASSEELEPSKQTRKRSRRELTKKTQRVDTDTVRRVNKKSKSKKAKKHVLAQDIKDMKESSSDQSTSSSEGITAESNGAEVTLDDFLKREEEDFVDDASCLVSEFQKAYSKVSNGLRKPNVLLTGITGAGKSSIINAVFGKNVAKTAAGYPVTQHFVKYSSDDMRVVIYDSKGLEHGEFESFIETTQHFFDKHKVGECGDSDAIHVIWYIINCAHSRWEPFEERICRELFNKVPLVFILNKADISSEEDRQRIRNIIADMALPNCVGVFDTVAITSGTCQTIQECPKCGSDDLVIRKKTATAYCMSCEHTACIKQSNGLDGVIKTTCKFLPNVVREAFISAQTVSYQLKESSAHQVIEEFWNEYENVRTPGGLLKVIAKMMARLSIVWEFKQHGQVYGDLWARDLVSHLKWKDKVNLLFHKKMEQQRVHIAALGILWNRCLRNMAVGLLQEFTASVSAERQRENREKSSKKIDQTLYSKFFRKFFTELNEENLGALEEDIRHLGFKTLIANDTVSNFPIASKLSSLNSSATNLSKTPLPDSSMSGTVTPDPGNSSTALLSASGLTAKILNLNTNCHYANTSSNTSTSVNTPSNTSNTNGSSTKKSGSRKNMASSNLSQSSVVLEKPCKSKKTDSN